MKDGLIADEEIQQTVQKIDRKAIVVVVYILWNLVPVGQCQQKGKDMVVLGQDMRVDWGY